MRHTTVAEERAADSIRARWKTDQRLRDEFGGDLAAAIAYSKAEARGGMRIMSGTVVSRGKGVVGSGAPGSLGDRTDPTDSAQGLTSAQLRALWSRDATLRGQYASFQDYVEACNRGDGHG